MPVWLLRGLPPLPPPRLPPSKRENVPNLHLVAFLRYPSQPDAKSRRISLANRRPPLSFHSAFFWRAYHCHPQYQEEINYWDRPASLVRASLEASHLSAIFASQGRFSSRTKATPRPFSPLSCPFRMCRTQDDCCGPHGSYCRVLPRRAGRGEGCGLPAQLRIGSLF